MQVFINIDSLKKTRSSEIVRIMLREESGSEIDDSDADPPFQITSVHDIENECETEDGNERESNESSNSSLNEPDAEAGRSVYFLGKDKETI